MATRYPIPPPAVDHVGAHINRTIDGPIALSNPRRAQLLTQSASHARIREPHKWLDTKWRHNYHHTDNLQKYLKNPLQSLLERTVS